MASYALGHWQISFKIRCKGTTFFPNFNKVTKSLFFPQQMLAFG